MAAACEAVHAAILIIGSSSVSARMFSVTRDMTNLRESISRRVLGWPGIVVLRGVPEDQQGGHDAEVWVWLLGLLLGRAASQNLMRSA